MESQNFDNYDLLVKNYGKTLVDKELDIELESQALGKEKFLKSCQVREFGTPSGTAQVILEEAVTKYFHSLVDYYNKANNGKAGKRHKLVSVLRELDPEKVAFIVCNTLICNATGYRTLNSMATLVGDYIDDEIRFQKITAKGINKESLGKRVDYNHKRRYLLAMEGHYIEQGELPEYKGLTKKERAIIGTKLIEIFCNCTGCAYLEKHAKGTGRSEFMYYLAFDNDLVQYINANNEKLASLCFYYRPMVIPPKEWTGVFGGGYHLHLKRPLQLVRTPKRVLKELYGDLDMPEVYKAVNAIQATPWRINKKVLEVMNEIIDWEGIPEGLGIASKYPDVQPVKPVDIDTNEDSLKAWKKQMLYYYQNENTRKGKRIKTQLDMATANLYKDYEDIYFPHNLDFRGRIYPVTSFSPQGDDLCKGLLEFSKGIKLGEHGARWLAMHGANCYGLDKKPLVERLEWVYDNAELIHKVATAPLDNLALWSDTDAPVEFLAFCFEWDNYMTYGESYESHLAVAFDGSCSGIQHFSAMLRDEIGGKAVNLMPSEEVQDIYKIVAEEVNKNVTNDFHNGTQDEMITDEKTGEVYLKKGTRSLAKEWLDYGITRKVTKRSVMTLAYGSKEYGFAEQVYEDTVMPALSHDINAFSKPKQASRYMAKHIWEAVSVVVVKAVEAMTWLQKVSGLLATDKDINGKYLPTTWVTPAGFMVSQKYIKTKAHRIHCVIQGSLEIRSGAYIEEKQEGDLLTVTVQLDDKDSLDTKKQKQGIAPNFVHSLDASHLMLTVNSCVDQGVTNFAMIHDSYGTHAGNADILFRTVREVFVQTYQDNDVLMDLYHQVYNQLSEKKLKELPLPPTKGNLDLELVKTSMYAFA